LTGHIRIVNDPLDLVPLIITFHNANYKKVYDLLAKSWHTEEELGQETDPDSVSGCLIILEKGNLIEEQWRMPEPGKTPQKEYRTTYSRFRANFQCPMSELGDLLHVSTSNDEDLRSLVDQIEAEVKSGNVSYNDLGRKFGVSPMFIKGVAKRMPHLDVKGQGLVLVEPPK